MDQAVVVVVVVVLPLCRFRKEKMSFTKRMHRCDFGSKEDEQSVIEKSMIKLNQCFLHADLLYFFSFHRYPVLLYTVCSHHK